MVQIPRLYVPRQLAGLGEILLEDAQAHYLGTVLRLGPGQMVHLFDDISGEWQAHVVESHRRRMRLAIDRQLRPREEAPDLWLCVAPLKRQRFEWVIEKAAELGVRRIQPVLTRRTVAERINHARLHAHMVEAAEQCGRTALPELAEAVSLSALVSTWDENRPLLFADEDGGAAMTALAPSLPAALLIGPEGGFDPAERESLLALPAVRRLTLGPLILRADTAAVAAIAQFRLLANR
ncbi:MAG: 16S rRNA (uracil(1498)-N(3))-methyltransferase [Sphingomonadaceae bacterium]